MICLDSSILIEYYRKVKKENSFLFQLAGNYNFKIPSIVKYEIYKGDNQQDPFWNVVFSNTEVLPFDEESAEITAKIYLDLKNKNRLIPTDDILIAATSIRNALKLATLNKKDFSRISGLEIIAP
ncbi:MAG: type II toxin-antitoxin system VapC family toxin [Phaeodactylibacter sp.]|nr:type II toxin-antitoxin system VapC family toxin [Phaeodactylibacter sp.]